MKPAGIILAGGHSSRMGHDKAFALLGGQTLLAHVVASLEPQVEAILINSSGEAARFASFGHPVLADYIPGHHGPLAGILTGLLWAKHSLPHVTHLLSAPCDIPGLPCDIGARLERALSISGAKIAIATDETGLQPTIGLWPVALADQMSADLIHRNMRGLQAWLSQFTVAEVPCSDLQNINTPDDLRLASLGLAAARRQMDAPGQHQRVDIDA